MLLILIKRCCNYLEVTAVVDSEGIVLLADEWNNVGQTYIVALEKEYSSHVIFSR